MTNQKPPAKINPPEPHDPYKIVSMEQLLTLFDGGAFLTEVLSGHRELQAALLDHMEEHGPKGCQGSMTIKVSYALGKQGDVNMGAKASFSKPEKPASSAAAFINEKGELTLYSPMMKRMHEPVRDVSPHDPETGEIRDID